MNSKVDLGELRGRLVLCMAIEDDAFHRVLARVLDEVTGLYEYAATGGRAGAYFGGYRNHLN